MCEKFKESKSGYYDWLRKSPFKRETDNEAISSAIRDVYEDSYGVTGHRGSGRSSRKGDIASQDLG
ncbi:hypothetical protein GCM10007383_22030 [Arenibacter certesii]|uniref:Transposase n=1 Tax=Arenibacter certesii TaxID=228955 RepID=A0A918MLS7_9FLAO|nr:hypothetical protein GCM10007383_22030 [Arenibacter certesii]